MGSIPTICSGVVFLGSSMVERLAVNQNVRGSSPTRGTNVVV